MGQLVGNDLRHRIGAPAVDIDGVPVKIPVCPGGRVLPLCAVALCNVSESFRIIWIILPLLAAAVDKPLRDGVSIINAKVSELGLMALWILTAFILAVTVHDVDLSLVPVMLNNPFNEVFS